MYEADLQAYDEIIARKSCRDFIEREVEPEKVEQIYQAILNAPTTESMMMFSVIRVTDPAVREKLSRQPAMKKAPLVLVFCADYRRWQHMFQGAAETQRNPEEGEYQLAVIDATIAAHNATLAANALGLSSVYLGDIMEHYEDRAAALGVPAGVTPILSLCIGYATEAQANRAPIKRYSAKYLFHENRYTDFSRKELMEMAAERNGHNAPEETEAFVQKVAKRAMNGKGSLERTRSIKAVLEDWNNIRFDD